VKKSKLKDLQVFNSKKTRLAGFVSMHFDKRVIYPKCKEMLDKVITLA